MYRDASGILALSVFIEIISTWLSNGNDFLSMIQTIVPLVPAAITGEALTLARLLEISIAVIRTSDCEQ